MDPDSHWALTAVSAQVDAKRNSDGRNWDAPGDRFGGPLPDPFVQFEMPRRTFIGASTTQIDTISPVWNDSLQSTRDFELARDLLPGGQPWLLWVGDEDADSVGEVMCNIRAPLDASELAAGQLIRTDIDDCSSVTIQLTCVP